MVALMENTLQGALVAVGTGRSLVLGARRSQSTRWVLPGPLAPPVVTAPWEQQLRQGRRRWGGH